MKTNLVKKGSEKNIEMFKMTNEELKATNGGRYEIIRNDDGEYILVWVNRISSTRYSFR